MSATYSEHLCVIWSQATPLTQLHLAAGTRKYNRPYPDVYANGLESNTFMCPESSKGAAAVTRYAAGTTGRIYHI